MKVEEINNKWDFIVYALKEHPSISFQTVRLAERIREAVNRADGEPTHDFQMDRLGLIRALQECINGEEDFKEFIRNIIWSIGYCRPCVTCGCTCSLCLLPREFEKIFGIDYRCPDPGSPLNELEDLIKRDLNNLDRK